MGNCSRDYLENYQDAAFLKVVSLVENKAWLMPVSYFATEDEYYDEEDY